MKANQPSSNSRSEDNDFKKLVKAIDNNTTYRVMLGETLIGTLNPRFNVLKKRLSTKPKGLTHEQQ